MHLTILHQSGEFTLKSGGTETRTEGHINLITGSVTYSDNDNRRPGDNEPALETGETGMT